MNKGMCVISVSIGVVTVLTGCSSAPPATVVVTVTQPAAAKEQPVETVEPAEAVTEDKTESEKEPVRAETFTMPKVRGMVLQDAQDKLQALGSYILDQEDATGLERLQVLDSNWRVCKQLPAPGRKVTTSATVRLESVKLTEDCP